jgi:hypothetical protein
VIARAVTFVEEESLAHRQEFEERERCFGGWLHQRPAKD